MRCQFALYVVAALASCAPTPEPARPAFWQVTGPHGEQGWLLGTIHSLPRPAAWKSPVIAQALDQADTVAVEVANVADSSAITAEYARLSHSPGLPKLSDRIDPALRPKLAALLTQAKANETAFADTETWAAALMLARAGQGSGDSTNGIDRAVLAAAKDKAVVELEGARAQLSLFDALPPSEQRDLLEAVVRDGGHPGDSADLGTAWRKGDFAVIEAETHKGMLADPELRAALFTGRNRAWTGKITAQLAQGKHLFVAVGAAHMAGTDGLPAMLATKGYKLTRLQ
jgi:uncharacterized protein